jgi:raffinose/stachyose/melibiose transport system permease protein
VKIFNDDIFIKAISNNGFIIVMSLLTQLPLALGIAYLLNRRLPGRAAFRTVFFMPFVVSEVITGVIFTYIFRVNGGLINTILGWLNIEGVAWLAEPDIVMYAVFVTLTWKYFGYHMILYLAGLQSIPEELEEAAKIDGAGAWGVFRYVTLPLLGSTIRLTIYLSVIGSLQQFELVWAMTSGGPVHASETMATAMFRSGFQKQLLGYGSALAIIIFIIAFTFSLIFQRYAMRRDIEGVY